MQSEFLSDQRLDVAMPKPQGIFALFKLDILQ